MNRIVETFRSVIDWLSNLFDSISDIFWIAVMWIVGIVEKLGYPGIVFLMALESSFVPFPSEVIIPPAGYLTVHGEMNILIVIFCGILGSVIGASINYWIGLRFGRKFLTRFGKYLFLNESRLEIMDRFFANHGEITTLIGRMVPVVRQYISFPAGVARMNYFKFAAYTALGASVWVIILAVLGRAVGNNIDLVKEHLRTIAFISVPVIGVIIAVYISVKKRIARRYKEGNL